MCRQELVDRTSDYWLNAFYVLNTEIQHSDEASIQNKTNFNMLCYEFMCHDGELSMVEIDNLFTQFK